MTTALAIETSQRQASIALGRGDDVLESRDLPQLKRHNLELMPTIDALVRDHGLGPADLAEVYLSVGPGSFTGLRVAVATGKLLTFALPHLKLVAVPTLDVLAAQAPADVPHVAACLNTKANTVYAAIYGPPTPTPPPQSPNRQTASSPNPLAAPLHAAAAHALLVESFAAATRLGRVPVVRESLDTDTRRDRFFRALDQRFHRDRWLDPIDPGVLLDR
ncbi:MAG: tRNA (adenosine(37)-N6)-threonylcarbamoyltransferase complex dimerization subunit type 1 TsaB, partial [Planctomycetota bacterium]